MKTTPMASFTRSGRPRPASLMAMSFRCRHLPVRCIPRDDFPRCPRCPRGANRPCQALRRLVAAADRGFGANSSGAGRRTCCRGSGAGRRGAAWGGAFRRGRCWCRPPAAFGDWRSSCSCRSRWFWCKARAETRAAILRLGMPPVFHGRSSARRSVSPRPAPPPPLHSSLSAYCAIGVLHVALIADAREPAAGHCTAGTMRLARRSPPPYARRRWMTDAKVVAPPSRVLEVARGRQPRVVLSPHRASAGRERLFEPLCRRLAGCFRRPPPRRKAR